MKNCKQTTPPGVNNTRHSNMAKKNVKIYQCPVLFILFISECCIFAEKLTNFSIQSFEMRPSSYRNAIEFPKVVTSGEMLEVRLNGSGFSPDMVLGLGLSTNPENFQSTCKNLDYNFNPSVVLKDGKAATFSVIVPYIDVSSAILYFCLEVDRRTNRNKFGEVGQVIKWIRLAEIKNDHSESVPLDLIEG